MESCSSCCSAWGRWHIGSSLQTHPKSRVGARPWPKAVAIRRPELLLSATGYIVAHHKINVNSKVTGRVAWIGVEKGDKVKEGQVLVRLEDQEFRAQYEQAAGAVESASAQLLELQNGSRPEEIAAGRTQFERSPRDAANDKITLDRTKNLVGPGRDVAAGARRCLLRNTNPASSV